MRTALNWLIYSGQPHDPHDSTTPTKIPTIPKQVAMFVRKHPFLEQVAGPFTKSDRRKFERDVYDYAEALGLDHAAAKKQVIKARGFCGEEQYDSDNSALGEEIDNSRDIIKRLDTVRPLEPKVLPSIEDAETGQAKKPNKVNQSPKKSPYFSSSMTAALPSKKRKADKDIQHSVEEEKENTPNDSKHAKRRKHIPGSSAAEAAPDKESKAARRAAKKAAKKAQTAHEREKSQTLIGSNGGSHLEPKTQAEAHENYLRSNQRDPHEHGQTLDKTEEERAEAARKDAAFVEKLRGDIQYEVNKEIDLYNDGYMKNVRQEVKDDLEDLKERREATEAVEKRLKEKKDKKDKKRKSSALQETGGHNSNKEKPDGELVNGTKRYIKSRKSADDFLGLPMRQEA